MKLLPSLSHSRNQVVLSTPLKHICDKLDKNSLTELKIGFEAGEFNSKRDMKQLLFVCQNEYLHKIKVDRYSPLNSIRVGWCLPAFVLPMFLEQVLPLLLSTNYVKHLQLCLDTKVPEATLAKIVSCNKLESLDLRAMRIQIPASVPVSITGPTVLRCVSDPRDNRGGGRGLSLHHYGGGGGVRAAPATPRSTRSTRSTTDDNDDSILRILPNLSKSITSLGLVDCDLTTSEIPRLAKALQHRNTSTGCNPLSHLSLRLNRKLDGEWNHLLDIGLKSLDLSLCDLDLHQGLDLARALETSFMANNSNTQSSNNSNNNNGRLDKLNVAGNYRLAPAVPQLVRVAATQLMHFNCSFCDVQNELQHDVFQILATQPNNTLKSFHMQATRVKDASSLIQCIQQNTSLQSLVIHHPKETFPLSRDDMLTLVHQAMPLNYHLGHFQFDCERQYWKYRDR
jgi:hypothetical protein